MKSILRFSLKVIRKIARALLRIGYKVIHFLSRVEGKATRLITGTDLSRKVDSSIALEQVYYHTFPQILPLHPALPEVGSVGSVVILVPSLDNRGFYGGIATALVVAAKMALYQKKPLKIVQTASTGKSTGVADFFKAEGIAITDRDISVVSVANRGVHSYAYLPIHPGDVFIASAWWDAQLLSELPLQKKFIYLIQDFEPIFYNNGDVYVLAEATYQSPNFVALCNTKLMFDFMTNRGYPAFREGRATYFEPAVSRAKTGYSIPKEADQKKILLLYGRPSVHRNLFFTALRSLDYVMEHNLLHAKDWELCMAGQDDIPDIRLSNGSVIKNLGKMGMDEYIKFSKKVDLAVSPMMAPHPNYPTLEFSSIGTAVVTTRYANKHDLQTYNKNIITAEGDVKELAEAINKAASLSHSDRLKNARESTIPADWGQALDEQLKRVTELL